MGEGLNKLRLFWQGIRQLSGDDAYERYLRHHASQHAGSGHPPLTKAEFFKRWQDGKWQGINRCC
jgi:uncharacterized short protein YbdD (DUF466 family)